MLIYLIRHGIAEQSDNKPDLERELTKEGQKKLKKIYKRISKIFNKPDLIFCSEAIRAKQTAEIIKKIWEIPLLISDENLNPNASIENYIYVLEDYLLKKEENFENLIISFVTHEPDLSYFANYLLSNSLYYNQFEKKIEIRLNPYFVNFKLKKSSLMIIEWDGKKSYLKFYATPSILKKL